MGYEANTMCKWDFDTLVKNNTRNGKPAAVCLFFFSQIRPALQLPVALFVYPVENSLHYQNPIIDH